jgi:hypothetical protein
LTFLDDVSANLIFDCSINRGLERIKIDLFLGQEVRQDSKLLSPNDDLVSVFVTILDCLAKSFLVRTAIAGNLLTRLFLECLHVIFLFLTIMQNRFVELLICLTSALLILQHLLFLFSTANSYITLLFMYNEPVRFEMDEEINDVLIYMLLWLR